MKRNLGIVASCIVGENPIDTLDKIKAHGFDCFFTLVKDLSFSLKMKEKAEKLGLDYEFIHAPWGGINEIWTAENDPQIYTDYLNSIDIASAASVKTVILHLSSGENAPFVSDKGFKRFDRLVEYAKQKKVVLAIENQRKLGNLSCALERYENNPTVGFCYDNGHEHCFTENIPFLDFYAKKVICTHIHDNFGKKSGDVHFLPFDGDCDFNYMMNGLNAAGYTGSLMLETSNKGYQQMGVDEFLSMAFERIKRISEI